MTTDITQDMRATQILVVLPLLHRFIQTERRRHEQPLLSFGQFRVLGFLPLDPESSLSQMADYLDVAHSTMPCTIERLVQRGLGQKLPAPQERIRVILTLIETGLQCFEQVFDVIHYKDCRTAQTTFKLATMPAYAKHKAN